MDTQFVKTSNLMDVWQWTGVLDFRGGVGCCPDWIVDALCQGRRVEEDVLFLDGNRLFLRKNHEMGKDVISEMVEAQSYIVRLPYGKFLVVQNEQFNLEFVSVPVE